MTNSIALKLVPQVCPNSRSLRKLLAASVAFAFVTMFVSDADAATRKTSRSSSAKVSSTAKAPHKEPFPGMQRGQLQIVVSIGSQHATLYSNGVRVEQTRVSTGTPGHPTPYGVFSVIEKDRWHHSNLYGNAPMYYMHRLTWSGVAMHEGMLPGFAASHGCIRMPTSFVSRLWQISRLGVRVVVARNDPAPYEFDHAKLFNPSQKPVADQISDARPVEGLRSTIAVNDGTTGAGIHPIVLAQAATVSDDAAPAATATAPRAPESIEAAPPPPAPAEVEATSPAQAIAPAAAPAEVETTATTPVVAPTPVAAAPEDTGNGEPVKLDPTRPEPLKPLPTRKRDAEPTKRAGQVAVFISKKEKKIFVRQGFVPLFDMPIEIANPDQPLGTHVFTAMQVTDEGAHMRWNAITMPAEQASTRRDLSQASKRRNGRRNEPAPVVSSKAPSTAAEALDRVQIPKEAIDRISEILVPGSSLIISDYGISHETGRYTEFVVLTH